MGAWVLDVVRSPPSDHLVTGPLFSFVRTRSGGKLVHDDGFAEETSKSSAGAESANTLNPAPWSAGVGRGANPRTVRRWLVAV